MRKRWIAYDRGAERRDEDEGGERWEKVKEEDEEEEEEGRRRSSGGGKMDTLRGSPKATMEAEKEVRGEKTTGAEGRN